MFGGEEDRRVFSQVWKSKAPSKVVALSWKGLLDRLPTRLNLLHKNALPPEVSSICVLCNEALETTNHLFLHCKVSWKVWAEIQHWLGVNLITPLNLFSHWRCWDGLTHNTKTVKKGFRLIWHATIWAIWKARNGVIFNNDVIHVGEVVDDI